ncbi:MAG TPA: aldo/keto reductase [Spirochaetia bacterium]|nr:aldo/keto reductase [Spirochaetia bacterium]
MQDSTETVTLGKTGIRLGALGVGTNTWGSRAVSHGQVRLTFDALLDAGVTLFDTAEIYTGGASERAIGRCIHESGRKPLVLSKFFPYPWRLGRRAMTAALHRSLARLSLERVDVYLLHFPFPPVPVETWADALADAVETGHARAVGVSNCTPEQTRRAHAALAARGIPLACNEVELNLLNRRAVESRLLDVCRELEVTVIGYRPLALGVLSGKYSADHRPGGYRGMVYGRSYLAGIQPLLTSLQRIAKARGKTVSQVALNWVLCKGALPIPGAKTPAQARENAGAMGWRLSAAEVTELEAARG